MLSYFHQASNIQKWDGNYGIEWRPGNIHTKLDQILTGFVVILAQKGHNRERDRERALESFGGELRWSRSWHQSISYDLISLRTRIFMKSTQVPSPGQTSDFHCQLHQGRNQRSADVLSSWSHIRRQTCPTVMMRTARWKTKKRKQNMRWWTQWKMTHIKNFPQDGEAILTKMNNRTNKILTEI